MPEFLWYPAVDELARADQWKADAHVESCGDEDVIERRSDESDKRLDFLCSHSGNRRATPQDLAEPAFGATSDLPCPDRFPAADERASVIVIVILLLLVAVGVIVYWRLRDTARLWNLPEYWERKRSERHHE